MGGTTGRGRQAARHTHAPSNQTLLPTRVFAGSNEVEAQVALPGQHQELQGRQAAAKGESGDERADAGVDKDKGDQDGHARVQYA